MTRSIDPILESPAPYTAVPSTLSLPIREPVSLTSVTIVGAPSLLKFEQQMILRIVPAVSVVPAHARQGPRVIGFVSVPAPTCSLCCRRQSNAKESPFHRRLFATRPTSQPATSLTGGLIDPGDRIGLLHARYRLGPGHQHGRLGGLDGASCGNGQRDGGHGLIVRDIGDDGEIVVAEAIPATNEL